MWRSWVLFTMVACAETPRPASVDVSGDDRLAALPADATLLASVDFPALAEGSGTAALLRNAGIDPAPLLALAEAGAGVDGFSVRDARLGCGAAGCVALLEGGFTEVGVDALTDAAAARFVVLPGSGELPGFDLQLNHADPWILRRLSATKAVFGEREAVREVWEAQRAGAAGLDVAELEGRIPAGGMWLLVRDLETFEVQASARASALGPEATARLHESIGRARRQLPTLDHVESLAVSLTGAGLVRARAVCADEATASDVELRLRAAALEKSAFDGVEVSRTGNVVELSGSPQAGALASLLGGAK